MSPSSGRRAFREVYCESSIFLTTLADSARFNVRPGAKVPSWFPVMNPFVCTENTACLYQSDEFTSGNPIALLSLLKRLNLAEILLMIWAASARVMVSPGRKYWFCVLMIP